MNNPNITMEEYIRLEEEKAQSHGETFNWKTTTFGRIRHYYEEECFTNFEEEFPAIVFGKRKGNSFDSEQGGIMGEYDDEREDFETEFPAIVFNNTSDTTPPCKPTVSPPNENQIDFRISLDESDDEYYTYSVLIDHLIRRIYQLDTTYQTFYPEQRIEFYSLNNVSVLPNNMAYSVNSIRRTGLQ
ncbi:hypothetical protein Tco_0719821 [Tanacetum coccineum]